MKRKLFILAIAMIMLVGLLAACGSEEADTDTDTDTAETGGDVNLEFWHIQTMSPRVDIISASVDRFIEANPQYSVEIVPIMNDVYKDRILIAMGAGEVPDIFMSWSGGPMIEYVNAGHIYDITDMFNASGLLGRYLEGGIAQATYNGRIWGVPTENVAVAAVWYNREIFESLGLSVPSTIEELEQVATTLVANEIIPFALANGPRWTGSMYFMYLATRHGGLDPLLDAVTGEGSFEHPSFEFAGERLQDWVMRGFFAPGFNGNDEDAGDSRQLLYAEVAAMHVMGAWFVSQVDSENADFLDSLGVFPFPAYENSTADQNIAIGTAGDNFYHVGTTSPSHQGAFDLIMQLLDEPAVAERIAAQATPPLHGVDLDEMLPLAREAVGIMQGAPAVQLWYDQFLPPKVGQTHLDTLQAIFGLTMTPHEANAAVQAALEAHLDR